MKTTTQNYTKQLLFMKKINASLPLLFICAVLLLSCKKDPKANAPQAPNESELITTMKLILTEQGSGTVSTFVFENIDGPGGAAPTQDVLILNKNKTYSGQVILLDQTKTPIDSISNDVFDERDDHQFFYTVVDANLTVAYTDFDKNGVPVGLQPSFITGNTSTGTLKVVLKHQPDVKPTSGLGNSTKGETDIEVTFNVLIN